MSSAIEKKPGQVSAESACGRREEILEAATRLFAEHGYSDTITQTLAEALQVGKGTLYRHFPSKRELFLAAVDRVMQRLREQVDASIAGVDDPLERIARAIRAYLSFFAEHPEYVELLIQDRAQFKDRKKPAYFEYQDQRVVRWRELYRSLIAQGRVRPMPVERITDVINHLLYGTMFTNYFTGEHPPFEQQAQDIIDVVFHGILSNAERSPVGSAPPSGEPCRPGFEQAGEPG